MTVYLDNPAGRLHALITGYKHNATSTRPHVAWFGALGVKDKDLPELLRRLALVLRLPGEIEAEVAKIDPREFDRDSIMRWQPRLTEMLASTVTPNVPPQQLVSQTSSLIAQQADPVTMLSLEQCSFVLSRHRKQPTISEKDIQLIRSLLDSLTVTVNIELETEPDLRDFLLHHISEMTRALNDLGTRGIIAVEEAYDQAIGAVARKAGEVTQRGYTRREAWKKFAKMLLTVTTILQVPSTALQLSTEIRGIIESPSPAHTEKVTIKDKIVVEPEQVSDSATTPEHKGTRSNGHSSGERVP